MLRGGRTLFSLINTMKVYSIFALLLTASLGSVAANEEASLSRLSLLTGADMSPYVFEKPDGSFSGINVEIIREIFKRMNLDFNIHVAPRKRVARLLQTGNFDGALSTLEVEDDFSDGVWLSDEMYIGNFSLISWDSTPLHSENLDMMSKFSILASTGRWQNSACLKPLVLLESELQMVRLLKLKRIDGVLAEEISFFNYARENDIFDEIKISERMLERKVKFVLSKQSPHLKLFEEQFNKHLNQLLEEGFIDKLFVKFLNVKAQTPKQEK